MARQRVRRPGTTGPEVVASGEPPAVQTPIESKPPPVPLPKDNYPRPGIAWGNVINDTVRIDDPPKLARRLRTELTLGEFRTDYGRLIEALDRSAKNLDDAGMLYRASKIEYARFELEANERLSILRDAAMKELMAEYKEKQRRSPTKDDLEDRCIENYPSEYRTINIRKTELEQAVKSLETLRDAWQSRCADLRLMTDKAARHTN